MQPFKRENRKKQIKSLCQSIREAHCGILHLEKDLGKSESLYRAGTQKMA